MGPTVTGLLPGPWLCLTSLLRRVWTLHLCGQDTTTQGQSVSSCFYKEKGSESSVDQQSIPLSAHQLSNTDTKETVSTITPSHSSDYDCLGPCDIRSDLTQRELVEYTAGDIPMPAASTADSRSTALWTMWGWSNAHAQIFLWPFSLESEQS